MATTHRSDLIDELEKALRDEAYDGGMGSLSPEKFADYVRGLAVTAANVVEESDGQTDERVRAAVIESVEEEFGGTYDGEEIAERAIAALRRSEVPEPSAEVIGEWFTSSHGVAVAAVAPMTDRGPAVMVDGRVICPNDVAALIEFKAQGEPSDAQVTAALDAFNRDAPSYRRRMRAALRAAHDAEVRAGVVAEEPEWEYGISSGHGSVNHVGTRESVDARVRSFEKAGAPLRDGEQIVRRRKVGLWVPVKQEGGA